MDKPRTVRIYYPVLYHLGPTDGPPVTESSAPWKLTPEPAPAVYSHLLHPCMLIVRLDPISPPSSVPRHLYKINRVLPLRRHGSRNWDTSNECSRGSYYAVSKINSSAPLTDNARRCACLRRGGYSASQRRRDKVSMTICTS